jgi:DNA-directed RNA polymerase subunit alpha
MKSDIRKTTFLTLKESRIENPRCYYSSFYIGPLSALQSLTVANAVRRVLLGEMKSIRITAVQIQGAYHEFSSLDALKESVLDLTLNLKELVFKANRPISRMCFAFLKKQGPGPIFAGDLQLPPGVFCVDPSQYIGTVSSNGFLKMKIQLNTGSESFEGLRQKGRDKPFLNLEKHKQESQLYPWIAIDSHFSPILKVNYTVEESNRKESQILLEITTDGSLLPREALFYSFERLANLFDELNALRLLNPMEFTYLKETL